jgi:hypothetical protein
MLTFLCRALNDELSCPALGMAHSKGYWESSRKSQVAGVTIVHRLLLPPTEAPKVGEKIRLTTGARRCRCEADANSGKQLVDLVHTRFLR